MRRHCGIYEKTHFILGAFCALSANAESTASARFAVGLATGAPFTDVVSATTQNNFSFISKSTNFTIGPSFQINLPLNLRIEADALYRPYSFLATSAVPAPFATSIKPFQVSGDEWRFPVLVQYRFSAPIVKPFVEAGLSFDHLANVSEAAAVITAGAGRLIHQTNAGIVLGGGVDVKIPFVRLSAELRYTHQSTAYFQGISNLNQAEVLVGVHF